MFNDIKKELIKGLTELYSSNSLDKLTGKPIHELIEATLNVLQISDEKQPDYVSIMANFEIPQAKKTWRNDFETYINQCKEAKDQLLKDESYINQQQVFNPNVNIRLSIEKSYVNFWGAKAGWDYKRKKKSKDIDWKSTFTNAISLNKVYYERYSTNNKKSGFQSDSTRGAIQSVFDTVKEFGRNT